MFVFLLSFKYVDKSRCICEVVLIVGSVIENCVRV